MTGRVASDPASACKTSRVSENVLRPGLLEHLETRGVVLESGLGEAGKPRGEGRPLGRYLLCAPQEGSQPGRETGTRPWRLALAGRNLELKFTRHLSLAGEPSCGLVKSLF